MTNLEKAGIVLMLSAISVSLGNPNSEAVVGVMRPVLMMIGTMLFAVGGKQNENDE